MSENISEKTQKGFYGLFINKNWMWEFNYQQLYGTTSWRIFILNVRNNKKNIMKFLHREGSENKMKQSRINTQQLL
jgi:hypothetical protein